MICILDYGSGNVGSVYNLVKYMNYNVLISNEDDIIRESTHIILPGVGSFGESMKKINNNLPMDLIHNEVVIRKKPFLGICVGMQVLAQKGFEFGEHQGLGWINGKVDKLNSGNLPLPHIGWNDIQIRNNSSLLENINEIKDFYFVHSFCFEAENDENIIATTNYGSEFTSIIQKENIVGVQFHPEKSQKLGMLLIKNFIENK